jgi:hypothetical protein
MTMKPLSKVAAILMALSIGGVLAVRADENKVAPSAEQVKADAEKAEKAAKEAAAKAEAEKAKAEAKAKEAAAKAEAEKAKAEAKAKEAAEKAKAKEEAAKAKEAEAKAKEEAAKAKAEAKAKEKAESAKKEEAKPAEGKEGMTQGEAALALADKLGLFPALPAGANASEASAALIAQGIAPFDGWKPGETLTVGDFAKVLVEAMGRGDEIPEDKKDKAEAYVDLLKGMGINVESGQEGIDEVGVLPEVFAAAVDGQSLNSDPLRNRTIYGYPDERVSGTDALVTTRPQAGVAPAPTPTPTPTPTPRPRTPTPTPRPPAPTPVDPTPVDPSPVVTNT